MADTLAVYLGFYLIGTFALAFAVLPLALSAFAPASAREILEELRPAFVLALVTTLPTTALPLIQRVVERIAARASPGSKEEARKEAADVIRATTSLAYVFASLGNYFTALFVIYAANHYQVEVGTFRTLGSVDKMVDA